MKILLLHLSILLSGCTAWQHSVDPDANRYTGVRQIHKQSEKTVLLIIRAEHGMDEEDGIQREASSRRDDYEPLALKRFKTSGLFSTVDLYSYDSNTSDFKIILNITEEEEFDTTLTVFSVLTAFLIPTFDKITISCSGEIIDNAGIKIGSISAQEEVMVMIELLAFPFIYKVLTVTDQAKENLFNAVLTQIMETEEVWK